MDIINIDNEGGIKNKVKKRKFEEEKVEGKEVDVLQCNVKGEEKRKAYLRDEIVSHEREIVEEKEDVLQYHEKGEDKW